MKEKKNKKSERMEERDGEGVDWKRGLERRFKRILN